MLYNIIYIFKKCIFYIYILNCIFFLHLFTWTSYIYINILILYLYFILFWNELKDNLPGTILILNKQNELLFLGVFSAGWFELWHLCLYLNYCSFELYISPSIYIWILFLMQKCKILHFLCGRGALLRKILHKLATNNGKLLDGFDFNPLCKTV